MNRIQCNLILVLKVDLYQAKDFKIVIMPKEEKLLNLNLYHHTTITKHQKQIFHDITNK